MTIYIDDLAIEADVPAMMAYFASFEPAARPRFTAVCDVCRQLCAIGVDCRCCENIGTRFRGGNRVKSSAQHSYLTVEKVLAALRKAVA